ncbi:MAG: hypothetical protein R2855_18020 [Thermomicrobiales bacterium]
MSGQPVRFRALVFRQRAGAARSRRRAVHYLPKPETSYLEARLWNDVFVAAQNAPGAAGFAGTRDGADRNDHGLQFQMEDILYELRDHSAGLNAGRWDYIFSLIKTFRTSPDHVLPDRAVQVTMAVPFMRAYTELLVRTCHKRGAHAIMEWQRLFPAGAIRKLNRVALAKKWKTRNAGQNAGYDGTWLAHPDLVPTANEVFDAKTG